MNLHSSFGLQSENINISVLFPMITVYKARLGWKWIVFGGGAETQWSEIEHKHTTQHKAERKKNKQTSVQSLGWTTAGVLSPPHNHFEDIKFGLATIAELHCEMPRKLFSSH